MMFFLREATSFTKFQTKIKKKLFIKNKILKRKKKKRKKLKRIKKVDKIIYNIIKYKFV